MNTRPIIKIAAIDLDGCAFPSNQTMGGKIISPRLVKELQSSDYSCFYVCTHRCTVNYKIHFKEFYDSHSRLSTYIKTEQATGLSIKQIQANYYSETKERLLDYTTLSVTDAFTFNIVKNLEELSGLKCIAISTPHDAINNRSLGKGYKEILEPIEREVAASISGGKVDFTPYEECKEMPRSGIHFFSYSKNKELTRIMMHASERYPLNPINMVYFDDNQALCDSALLLDQLPQGVDFAIYHHNGHTQELIPIVKKPVFSVPSRSYTINHDSSDDDDDSIHGLDEDLELKNDDDSPPCRLNKVTDLVPYLSVLSFFSLKQEKIRPKIDNLKKNMRHK
jgi:hypothetical protein